MGGFQGEIRLRVFSRQHLVRQGRGIPPADSKGKTVTEYAERFKHLSRFYTLPLYEEW